MFFKFLLWLPTVALAFTLTTSNMKGWDKEEVEFRFNPANCSVSSGSIEEAINHAVDLWNAVPTSRLRVSYGGTTSETSASASPVIRCVTTGISGAVGVGIISTRNGVIQDGEIQLNSEVGDSGNINSKSEAQLKITLAHEMGHIFGLGHSAVEDALMYFSLGSKQQAILSQDDMDGMTWLYPRKEPGDGVLGCGTLALLGAGGKGGNGISGNGISGNGSDSSMASGGSPASTNGVAFGNLWVFLMAAMLWFWSRREKLPLKIQERLS